jgi:hypothetical protein
LVELVVMVLNVVGEGDFTVVAELVTLIEEVAVLVAVPVGINVAREFGKVVCPEVNTAQAPARTTSIINYPHIADIVGKGWGGDGISTGFPGISVLG